MYLDQEDGEDSEVAIDTGLPIRRKRVSTKLAQHIVYKRKMTEDDHTGDYGTFKCQTNLSQYFKFITPIIPY